EGGRVQHPKGGITGRLPPETGRSASRGVVTVHRVGTGFGRRAPHVRSQEEAREISVGGRAKQRGWPTEAKRHIRTIPAEPGATPDRGGWRGERKWPETRVGASRT